MQKLIAQGAEAKIFEKGNEIIKDRFKKSYRIKEIDEKLRGFRTRREAKVLEKLKLINFPAPRLIKSDNKEKITIEKINGELLKNILDLRYNKLSDEIGNNITSLHNNNIIHGDLTTSNMILNKKIYFIDFGLSFFSEKTEDKAVDLHLLKEGLKAKHNNIWKECYKIIINTYINKAENGKDIIKRLEVVEKRGRYKRKNENQSSIV